MSLKDELIAVIEDDKNTFDMSQYVKDEYDNNAPSCETACCFAGWICALRKEKFNSFYPEFDPSFDSIHDAAVHIWKSEENEPHPDFYAEKHWAGNLDLITREDGIVYLKTGAWPDKSNA